MSYKLAVYFEFFFSGWDNVNIQNFVTYEQIECKRQKSYQDSRLDFFIV